LRLGLGAILERDMSIAVVYQGFHGILSSSGASLRQHATQANHSMPPRSFGATYRVPISDFLSLVISKAARQLQFETRLK